METLDFRTKTEFKSVKHASCRTYWPVAIDIGYSAVKTYSPNTCSCFPSYAKKLGLRETIVGSPVKDEIWYIDNTTNEVWRVGESAMRSVSANDTNETDEKLFSRHRYLSEMFCIIARTGIGFGMMNTGAGAYNAGLAPYVQTGLPPAYLKGTDRQELTQALTGHHKFTLRFGDRTQSFDFTLEEKDIGIMAQPEGTLMSISMNDDTRSTKSARNYFSSNVLIADAGFETVDLYELYNRQIRGRATFTSVGMHAILDKTIKKMQEKCGGVQVDQLTIQAALEAGKVSMVEWNPSNGRPRRVYHEIAPFLEEAVNEVFDDLCSQIGENIKDSISEYRYLVLTGGTFAPWEQAMKEYFGALCEIGGNGLTILMGNENCKDTTDLIYTNVRGYYLYAVSGLRRKECDTAKSDGE